ncbi:MAG TPA: trigger factor [Vicinamibacterales bacterium]|nr:trigger factor [Vicinamibacterales bacterium]
MKAELVDVNETRKSLSVEIPREVVEAEIDRHARDYSRKARIPGFRPGKVPARVVRQRYKDQILHDVAHELVPRAVDEALREKGVEPVSTPDIREVVVEEGRALTFTASFDTLPPFELGDFSTVTLSRKSAAVSDEALNDALQRLRERAARYDVVEDRGVVDGDIVTVDIDRTDASGGSDSHKDVAIEIGGKANPPGFDEQLLGLEVGAVKSFSITFPADYPNGELANSSVSYTVTVKAIKRRTLPELDDEFAKDLGEFENFEALRARVRADLEHEARHAAEHDLRGELMKSLATRVPFEVPASLIEREIDRRLEEFAGRLMQQNIDPRQAGIDWGAFRESQRDVAREAVGGALVLDEVARKEAIEVSEAEIEQEIARYAERSGRTPAAVRASLEKEGGISRIYAGLRREKSVDYIMARATISGE